VEILSAHYTPDQPGVCTAHRLHADGAVVAIITARRSRRRRLLRFAKLLDDRGVCHQLFLWHASVHRTSTLKHPFQLRIQQRNLVERRIVLVHLQHPVHDKEQVLA
jgi:hypothetical protein